MSRLDEYRDLLEAWCAWWNDRERIIHDPAPLRETVDALHCDACDQYDLGGRRCHVCGRTGKP